jgi:hypothetical protein
MIDAASNKFDETYIKRWFVLLFLSLTLFAGYFFADAITPLQILLEAKYGWDQTSYDLYFYSGYFINAIGFVLIAGLILHKFGILFTGKLASLIMLLGALLNLYALTPYFTNGGFGNAFFNSFLSNIAASTKLSVLGIIIFSIGFEMMCITIAKSLAKWFLGKEIALSFSLLFFISRIGTSLSLFFSADFADLKISESGAISGHLLNSVIFSVTLLAIGFLSFFTFNFFDKKNELPKTISNIEKNKNELKFNNFSLIFKNKPVIYIAILYSLFFVGVFSLFNFISRYLIYNLDLSNETITFISAIFPFGSVLLSPFIGYLIDKKGQCTKYLLYSSILLTFAYLIFILFPLSKPILFLTIIFLAISFSVIPGTLLPLAVKIVEESNLAFAFAIIHWFKNIGLIIIPLFINYLFAKSNPDLSEKIADVDNNVIPEYKLPMFIFLIIGLLTVTFTLLLIKESKKNKNLADNYLEKID